MTLDPSPHPMPAVPAAARPAPSDRLTIGMIAPPWVPIPPPAYGGTESVIDCLARGLRRAGHDVVLFTVGTSTVDVTRRWVLDGSGGYLLFLGRMSPDKGPDRAIRIARAAGLRW